MLIDLLTIPKNGYSYKFDESSSETNEVFVDLIGNEPFKIHLTIKPMAEAYKVSGGFSSHCFEVCSRCGYEIYCPFKGTISEIIIIEKQKPRNTQVSQSSINFDFKQPSVTYINKPQFDLKEFLHEIMASSLESFPVCEDFKICQSRQFHLVSEKIETSPVHPSFSLLKDFKVKF